MRQQQAGGRRQASGVLTPPRRPPAPGCGSAAGRAAHQRMGRALRRWLRRVGSESAESSAPKGTDAGCGSALLKLLTVAAAQQQGPTLKIVLSATGGNGKPAADVRGGSRVPCCPVGVPACLVACCSPWARHRPAVCQGGFRCRRGAHLSERATSRGGQISRTDAQQSGMEAQLGQERWGADWLEGFIFSQAASSARAGLAWRRWRHGARVIGRLRHTPTFHNHVGVRNDTG